MQMQHLVLDAFVADGRRLGDVAAILELLDTLPERIGMTKIAPPYVFRYSGVKPEDWGVTGVVLIAESHISIHTFAEHRRFHLEAGQDRDGWGVERIGQPALAGAGAGLAAD